MWHWHVEILLTLIIKLALNKILQTVHWIGAKNSQEIIIFLKQNTYCWIAWTYVIKQLVIFLHWFNYYFECLHVLWKSYDFVLNLENLSLIDIDKTDLFSWRLICDWLLSVTSLNLFRQDFQHGGYHKFQTMDSLSSIIFYDLCAFWNSYQHSTIMPFYIDWLVASVSF